MKINLLILIPFFPLFVFPQGIDNLWVFGAYSWAGPPYGGVDLNFSSGNLSVNYASRPFNVNCTNGVICDKNGNLRFCSNGVYVANALFDTMSNGSGLNPGVYTTNRDSLGLTIPQANLIISLPGDTTRYYLFHETCDDYGATYCTLHLYYSLIDMTQDNGKGSVIQKNVILLNDSLVEGRLTACKHANGRDWWLVTHQYNTDLYYKYLITPYGISGPFAQKIGVVRDIWGQSVFSPDGKFFAYYESDVGDLDIFGFNRCTGDFSFKAHVDINDSANSGGVAFSPNSKILYVSSMNYVYQFDVTASNIPSTQTTVAVYDGYYSPAYPFASTFYLSQLAPDGKVYINCGNGTLDIHVINYPDNLGLACDVCQHCIHLPAYNHFTIPNHPNYHLGALVGSPCDTVTSVIDNGQLIIDNKIQVFPNPVVNREVTFTYPSTAETKTISVFNVEGKEVVQYTLPQWSSVQHVKLPELAHGVYLARLMGKEQSANVKFVVE